MHRLLKFTAVLGVGLRSGIWLQVILISLESLWVHVLGMSFIRVNSRGGTESRVSSRSVVLRLISWRPVTRISRKRHQLADK